MNELWLTQQVATELNAAEGADYQAVILGEQDNVADTLLVSESGRWPRRTVQVTTIPSDIQHREVSGNRERIEKQLREAILARENGCVVTVHLSDKGDQFGLRPQQIQRLAELIGDSAGQPSAEWSGEELWELDEELSESVSHLSVHHLLGYGTVDVLIPFSHHTRVDGAWIEEAIDKKVKRYGRQTVRNITLVIGALGLVTASQVTSFRESHAPAELPFAEIWLVSPFDGVFCLKPTRS
jgi:hypothetical protein